LTHSIEYLIGVKSGPARFLKDRYCFCDWTGEVLDPAGDANSDRWSVAECSDVEFSKRKKEHIIIEVLNK
jgi:hypothetical protein